MVFLLIISSIVCLLFGLILIGFTKRIREAEKLIEKAEAILNEENLI